jgi:HSP20 family protein
VSLIQFDPVRELDRFLVGPWFQASRHGVMPMDVYRNGDVVEAFFDLPGVDPGSIELTVEDNPLTFKAQRQIGRPGDAQVVAAERWQGELQRQLLLGEHLDTEHIEARYVNGVLHLSAPVSERAKPRRIEVRRPQALTAGQAA